MIQQICLTPNKSKFHINFDQPIELVMNSEDYERFKKTIVLLFDKESIKRIKKFKKKILGS